MPSSSPKNVSNLHPPSPWGEREVRRLLRGLRRPHRLEHEPLAQLLCELFGNEDPYQVVLHLIRQTFINKGLVGKRLYEMIQRCDVDASSTQATTAYGMGLSPRQFFRYRREAVSALVAHINSLVAEKAHDRRPMPELANVLAKLDPGAASEIYGLSSGLAAASAIDRIEAALDAGHIIDDALLKTCKGVDRQIGLLKLARACFRLGQLPAGDKIQDAVHYAIVDATPDHRDCVEFELLLTSYYRAAMFQDAEQAAEMARHLREASQASEENLLTALFAEAESAIRLGAASEAADVLQLIEQRVLAHKDLRGISILMHLRAAVSFLQDDLQEAYASIGAAQLALRHRPFDSLAVTALAGRISLAMGVNWRATSALLSVPEAVSTTVATSRQGERVRVSGSRLHAYGRLLLQLVDQRAQLAEDAGPIASQVQEATALSEEAGYSTLNSLGLATRAALYSRSGERASAQNCYVAAWACVIANHDFFNGHDLFVRPVVRAGEFGPIDLDEYFLRTLYEQTTKRFPTAPLVRVKSTRLQDEFWRSAMINAYNSTSTAQALPLIAEKLAEEISLTAGPRQDLQKHRASFIREVSGSLSLFVPISLRPRFTETLTLTLASFYNLLAAKMLQTHDEVDKAS